MTDNSALGDRMKRYEEVPRTVLTPRMPMIVRVDGRAFHTYVKRLHQPDTGAPWNPVVRDALSAAARALLGEITGAKIAYLQSDEVSVLVTDYDKHSSQPWFGKVAQKVASVAASIATIAFNRNIRDYVDQGLPAEMFPADATFDARAFVVPAADATNYFVWRQQDATRNSVSMLARHHFAHERLVGKSWSVMQEMLHDEHGVNWNALPTWQRRGWCVLRTTRTRTVGELREEGVQLDIPDHVTVPDPVEIVRQVIEPDWEIPIFTKDPWYVERHVDLQAADQERRTNQILEQILGPGWQEAADEKVEVDPRMLARLLEGGLEED